MRALLIAAAVILWPILALGEITGPARVIDGDTIEVAGERIRLSNKTEPPPWPSGVNSQPEGARWQVLQVLSS